METQANQKDCKNKCRVLYVEDDPSNRKLFEKMIKELVLSVDMAENGLVALDLLKEKSFDIIFSDVSMPEMNGVEFALQVKKMKKNQPIIMVSGQEDADFLIDMMDLECERFIEKPFNIEQIKDSIETYCK